MSLSKVTQYIEDSSMRFIHPQAGGEDELGKNQKAPICKHLLVTHRLGDFVFPLDPVFL